MDHLGFDILYEDGPCLIISKPASLLTQAPPGIDSLEVRIKRFLETRGAPGRVYLGVPHRLDRPVSGAMVFATSRKAAHRISKQFERRQIEKTYWACVAGRVEPAEGTWRDILWKVHGQPRAQVVAPDHPQGQSAVLHYRTLGYHPFGSWLEIVLETGRTHQVRVQAATRGHHLLGDAYYGSNVPFGPPTEDERLRPIALHARSLALDHPLSRQRIVVYAPLPAAWKDLALPEALIAGNPRDA